jgi:hypothetical protein
MVHLDRAIPIVEWRNPHFRIGEKVAIPKSIAAGDRTAV